ncbi:MAG: VOC family protein [Clostridiaceae bacterium]
MKAEISPYLYFNGKCKEAAYYYAHVFEAEAPRFMTYKDVGMTEYEDADKLILYTEVIFDGTKIMMSDNTPGEPMTEGSQINLVYTVDDPERLKAVFENFRVNEAEIAMELGETFFASHYGMLTDKYGFNWQLSCPKPTH